MYFIIFAAAVAQGVSDDAERVATEPAEETRECVPATKVVPPFNNSPGAIDQSYRAANIYLRSGNAAGYGPDALCREELLDMPASEYEDRVEITELGAQDELETQGADDPASTPPEETPPQT